MIETVTPRDYLQEIISRCGAAGCNRVIVSSEFFWAAPAMQSELEHHKPTAENFGFLNRFVEQCRTLFSVFGRVEVVVYLRKQESWFDSFFNQQIKDGFSIPDTHELAAPKNYLLYYRNLEMWAKHFGQDNIIVRFYEEVKTDVVEDFCLITGIDMSKGVTRPPENTETVNPRLSPTALRIMQRALQLQLDPTVVDLLKHTLRQTSSVFAGKGRRSPIFPDSFYIDVSECYRKDNLKLSEIFPEAIIYLEQGSRTEHDTMVIPGQPEAPDNTIEQLLDHLLLILMNHKED
jgi:hypothetical protein